MFDIIEKIKLKRNRLSTNKMYYKVWKTFNTFLVHLDCRPESWEQRALLYCAFLVQKGTQSSTIKSYVSAIKCILKDDGYAWNDNIMLLNALMRGCRMVNDHVTTRLPIHLKLLELMLFEIDRIYDTQPNLTLLYQTIFIIGYYGLFRVGELVTCTENDHIMKAKDVHVSGNKEKILIVLYSSKTHGRESSPQEIKITGNGRKGNRFFCPFLLIKQYMIARGGFVTDIEPFFIFRDGSVITDVQIRKVLNRLFSNLGLDARCYGMHSLHAGRAGDMLKTERYSIEDIKRAGRWKSNAVYRYLKH